MLRNGLEPWHLIVVALVVIVLFGSKKLPEAARGLGKSMRILKSEARAMKADGTAESTAAPAEPVVVQPTAVTPGPGTGTVTSAAPAEATPAASPTATAQ